MGKLLKWLGLTLGAIVLLLGAFAAYVVVAPLPSYEPRPPALQVEATPERVRAASATPSCSAPAATSTRARVP